MVEANQESSDNNPNLGYRSQAKAWTIAGTIIYAIPALFFSCIFLGIFKPGITDYIFLLPATIPVYLMWWSYLHNRKISTLPALLVPILYYAALILVAKGFRFV